VNPDVAYEEEMNEVALFETALRAAVPTQPDRRLGADLVPRIAQIARSASIEAEQARGRRNPPRAPRRPRLALLARVGIAVALVPLLLAGLAVAGVTVPDPARSALETIGVELPNQPDESSRGGDEGTLGPDGTSGSATGQERKSAGQENGKAKGKSKPDDPSKPGRRVRRHGEGPIPGPPASPPEGEALGQSTAPGVNGNSSGSPSGKAGSSRGQGAVHGLRLGVRK
jgi:hypothetical protein